MNSAEEEASMRSLREWRAEQLLSTKKLSALTGVSNKTILDIEHRRRTPTFRTIQRLSETLEVDPKEVTEFAEAIARRSQDTVRGPARANAASTEAKE
jgi:transcriptional regulator with XRE-family HTH domain